MKTFEYHIRIVGGLLGAFEVSGDRRLLRAAAYAADCVAGAIPRRRAPRPRNRLAHPRATPLLYWLGRLVDWAHGYKMINLLWVLVGFFHPFVISCLTVLECGLLHYQTNRTVRHATASAPVGPWQEAGLGAGLGSGLVGRGAVMMWGPARDAEFRLGEGRRV